MIEIQLQQLQAIETARRQAELAADAGGNFIAQRDRITLGLSAGVLERKRDAALDITHGDHAALADLVQCGGLGPGRSGEKPGEYQAQQRS